MADDNEQDETGAAERSAANDPTAQASAARRRPTAAASAASRARRIGGARATPSAAPPSPDTQPASGAAESPSGVSVTKPPATPTKASERAGSRETAPAAASGPYPAEPIVITQAPRWLPWSFAGVLAACAIAMLVLVLVASHSVWYSKPSVSALRDRVLAAAKTCTAAANTYSYRTIPQDEAKGLACSTGLWTNQYRRAMTHLVTPVATKLKASQAIQINTAGIETVGRRQWTVVIFGQTTITQTGAKARQDPFAAVVTMQHVGDQWLISKISLVNSAG